MNNASQMYTLLAKLPDIPQDFGSLVNNLVLDLVETLFVDEFGGRLDYFIADSIRKHLETHLNTTNFQYGGRWMAT
jgi:hypothetical protein